MLEYNLSKEYKDNPDIVWMSPGDFLRKVPHIVSTVISAAQDVNPEYFDKGSLERIKEGLESGSEFEPLYLNYEDKQHGWPSHEGKHRAFVARQLGIDKVPVIVKGENYQHTNPDGVKTVFKELWQEEQQKHGVVG